MADKTRLLKEILDDVFSHEEVITDTSNDQIATEYNILELLETFESASDYDPELPKLHRVKHVSYLTRSLFHLTASYQCLDCSRPWLCYWILHSLYLLDQDFSEDTIQRVSYFLNKCQNSDGGFGGGPGQVSHLAPTYAAVCAVATLADDVAFQTIDREGLYKFLKTVKQPNGAFAMHEGGEVDIRGVYCAIAVARLTNTYTESLFEGTAEWVATCQTFEGGFAGCPGAEAHGGYTFCGLATLLLLGKPHLCDIKSLLRWSVNRQMRFEGGFQGRANKLVDGCYSFWLGGVFPVIHGLLAKEDPQVLDDGRWLFHQEALQEYILICCQHSNGGFIDKPTKDRDLYHTCYILSGLSTAQRSQRDIVLGAKENLLRATHPLFNVGQDRVPKSVEFYHKLPLPDMTGPSKIPNQSL